MTRDEEARMTFIEHLTELRSRLLRVVIVLGVAFFACLGFSEYIFEFIQKPLLSEGIEWVTLSPMEPIIVLLKIAGYASLAICFPYVIYEICAFVFPGLKPGEKRVALVMLIGCGIFAILGTAAAYFIVTPNLIPVMKQWTPDFIHTQLRMKEAVGFIMMLLLGFAAASQFPMILLVLIYMGLVTKEMMKTYRRVVYVLLAVAAAILTPTPDPFNMMIMYIPLLLMYEVCILLSNVIRRKPAV